jgi:hypothetical protein
LLSFAFSSLLPQAVANIVNKIAAIYIGFMQVIIDW